MINTTRKEEVPIPTEDYNSANTRRLSLQETKDLLLSLREIQDALKHPIV